MGPLSRGARSDSQFRQGNERREGKATGRARCKDDQAPPRSKVAWAGAVDLAQIRDRQGKVDSGGEWRARREEDRLESGQPTAMTAPEACESTRKTAGCMSSKADVWRSAGDGGLGLSKDMHGKRCLSAKAMLLELQCAYL